MQLKNKRYPPALYTIENTYIQYTCTYNIILKIIWVRGDPFNLRHVHCLFEKSLEFLIIFTTF